MEPLGAPAGVPETRRTKSSPEHAKEAGFGLPRLPVEVLRRVLSFLNYQHQTFLLHCSSGLRNATLRAMTLAGAF